LNNSGIVHHRINPPETIQRFVNGITTGIVLGDIRLEYQRLTTQTSNLVARLVKILFRWGDQRDCRPYFAQPTNHNRPQPSGRTGYDDYWSIIHRQLGAYQVYPTTCCQRIKVSGVSVQVSGFSGNKISNNNL
jgi:hypothetical protein